MAVHKWAKMTTILKLMVGRKGFLRVFSLDIEQERERERENDTLPEIHIL